MVYGLNDATARFFAYGAIVQGHKSVILQVSYQCWMPTGLGWRITGVFKASLKPQKIVQVDHQSGNKFGQI